jgi:hypothetical protein
MRYCYTEAGKAEITLELTIADLQELRAIAVMPQLPTVQPIGSAGYRMTWPRRINPPLKASALSRSYICCGT